MSKFIERIQNDRYQYVGPGYKPAAFDKYRVHIEWQEKERYIWVCTRRKVMASNTIKEWGYYVVVSHWEPVINGDQVNLYKEVEVEVKHEDFNIQDALNDDEIIDDGGCGNPSCILCYPEGEIPQPFFSEDVQDQ